MVKPCIEDKVLVSTKVHVLLSNKKYLCPTKVTFVDKIKFVSNICHNMAVVYHMVYTGCLGWFSIKAMQLFFFTAIN